MNLGRYFTQKGIKLSGFYGRNSSSVKKASEITNSTLYTSYEKIIKDSDILFITTPDDIISTIDRELSKFDLKNKSVCHASGSLKSTVLSNAKLSGALIYSIHPMFAFSNKEVPLNKMENMFFSIEGELNAQNIDDIPIINLINSLGNKYFIRDINDSATYHLANVFVSNLVLSLINIGTSYLEKLGLTEHDAIHALFPLIQGNIENIYENGFEKSLTGPAVRGDIDTIKKHLQVLNDEDKDVYTSLSLNLLKLVGSSRFDDSISEFDKKDNIDFEHLYIKENALKNLLNTSMKHKEIFKILGGTE